jgi:hypothetical protein
MVKLKERFVEVINNHEKVRPYLREHPVTAERAKINLRFCDKKGVQYCDGTVAFVLVGSDNKIYYCGSELNDLKWNDLFEEPYSEAVKIVHGEKKK